MATYEVPLSPDPQSFSITLGATEYRLSLLYLDTNQGGWLLNIGDTNGSRLVDGIPLVTGHDLLEQHRHLGIAGTLTVATDADADAIPTFDNLGVGSHLYFTAS